ncbi:MAG: hypothetical protein IJ465_04530 [Clostridia bacterium]|nr:hypothetical protein [Clostridia bacterium]
MRIWKKVLCLTLSILLLFTLVACDPKEDTPGGTTDGSGGVDSTTSTTTSADGANPEGTTTTGTGTTNDSGSANTPTKPADLGNIIPAGYGTDAWKPFGTPAFYNEKPLTTNTKVFPNSYVETKNGRTRMYINGKETAPIMYFGAFQTAGQISEVMDTIGHMMATGNNYVYVDVNINISNENVRYASIKTALEDVLLEYPDAYLLVRYTPWANAEFYGGNASTDNITFKNGSQLGLASMASDAFINGAVEQTREMIAYLSQYPEVANRIVGYIPLVYETGEWFSKDYWDGPVDYSQASVNKFRQWLKYRYGNDVAALRKAWGNNSVTFESATIPQRIPGFNRGNSGFDTGELYQLASQNRSAVDYLLYLGDITVNRMEQFARAVKMETGNRSLFVAFYGYHTELFSPASQHFNAAQLLNNNDIDMLGSPVNYENRNEGGTGISMTFANSVNANNKIWMDESDYRSPFTYKKENMTITGDLRYIKTAQGMYEVQRREMGRLMVEGSGTWWADIGSEGWFNDRQFWAEQKKLSDLYVKYNQIAKGDQYDAAFIMDEASAVLAGSPWTTYMSLLRGGRHAMATSGINFSMYLMEDLLAGKVSADLLVILNCNTLTADEQKKLEAQVHKDGRTVMWMTGFGELTDAQIKALTGMTFSKVDSPSSLALTLKPNAAANFSGNTVLLPKLLDPLYKVTSTDVNVLGAFGDGTPGMVSKKVGKSTQIFCASDVLTIPLLQSVAKMAGVNVYLSTGDVYYGNDNLAVIHTKTAGKKTITLSKKSDVYCYFTKKWHLGVTEVTVDMAAETTEYFFIGSQKEFKAAGIG